jgi:hypothetical protein
MLSETYDPAPLAPDRPPGPETLADEDVDGDEDPPPGVLNHVVLARTRGEDRPNPSFIVSLKTHGTKGSTHH